MISPCKDCQDRYINIETNERCHTKCKRYQEFVQHREKVRHMAIDYCETRSAHVEQVIKSKRKYRRNK